MPEHHPHSTASAPGGERHRLRPGPGISNFSKLRHEHKYYVDKTAHLPQLLRGRGPLLLTRPRRFGKTLTLDTLRCFLQLDYQEPGNTSLQKQLFAGLAIMEDPALRVCRERCMGQYPVIALSLNTVDGASFEEGLHRMRDALAPLITHLKPVLEGAEIISDAERRTLNRYDDLPNISSPAELLELLPLALPWLCSLLYRIYSRSVYILIDEYDTPLARAWSGEQLAAPQAGNGYYGSMANLLRSLLHPLLKPQPALQPAIARCILSGCTRISRESLFSGANNLQVLDLDDPATAALMGFTQAEVSAMLDYYGLGRRLTAVKRWYNGYQFGGVRIYNPWSIACFCKDACTAPGHRPVSYWAHSGRNDELQVCLQHLPASGLEQLRQLSAGQRVTLRLREAFSYDELLHHPDAAALFTLLYHTGYITRDNAPSAVQWRMRIPNAEVRDCFERQILELYDFRAQARARPAHALLRALLQGDALRLGDRLSWLFERYLSFNVFGPRSVLLEKVRAIINDQDNLQLRELFSRISDTQPERVYHLFVFGLLSGFDDEHCMLLPMEHESGMGRCDLALRCSSSTHAPATLCIAEFKAAAGNGYQQLLTAARQGLEQIEARGYARGLAARYPGCDVIWAYGLGCQGKSCVAACRRLEAGQLPDGAAM